MAKNYKLYGFGFFSWLVPFVVSFLFYNKNGQPTLDANLTHNILVVVGVATGSYLLVRYFKGVHNQPIKEGIIVGLVWLIMNLVLDVIILLPMSKIGIDEYISRIGISYLSIFLMSVMAGYVVKNSKTIN